MRSLILSVVFVLSLSFVLTGCGGSPSTAATPTLAPVTITLTTDPNPPAAGDLELQFTVVDETGQPVTGADFDVIADHTDMSGMIMHGKAVEQSSGVYTITANFSMAGNWLVTVQVKKDGLNYKQDIEIRIE